ncbi:MAG: hypothetical protein KAR40_13760, partial [Candidatus Sabulitectum sp.]|nr:hypothetical protein [Candidatus Sabulitectum sp.]
KANEATRPQDSSGSTEFAGYKPGWYWMTCVSEGDTWYPIYINEKYYLMDGKPRYELDDLKNMIVKPAIMPTGL